MDQFLTFVYTERDLHLAIYCPCHKCENHYNYPQEVVCDHIISSGFLKKYRNWIYHGESYDALHGNQDNETRVESNIGDDMVRMIYEATRMHGEGIGVENDEGHTTEATRYIVFSRLTGSKYELLLVF